MMSRRAAEPSATTGKAGTVTEPLRADGQQSPWAARTARLADRGPFDQARHPRLPRLPLGVLAAVFIGGCVGGLARYELTTSWTTPARAFPWATLAINTSGAFALAVLLVLVSDALPPTTYVRPLLGTGFCGAWTTFSAITAGADQLIAHGAAGTGAAYVLGSAVGGLGAAGLGLVMTRAMVRRRRPVGNQEVG